jgi:hypothetical protein
MVTPASRQVLAWTGALVAALVFAGCGLSGSGAFPDDGFALCNGATPGCACEPGQVGRCSVSGGEGSCSVGYRFCGANGTWEETCHASTAPLRESLLDDTTPYPCGGCDSNCFLTKTLPEDASELTDENSDDVTYDAAAGGVILNPNPAGNGLFAYIASSEGFVTKVAMTEYYDALGNAVAKGTDLGRYLVGRQGGDCRWWGEGCNNPSRTAVDNRGNGYVASRAFGGQAYITKIAGYWGNCNNGASNTSPGGVGSQLTGWDATNDQSEDDCVLWNVPIGDPDCISCGRTGNEVWTDECYSMNRSGGNPDCAHDTGCSSDSACDRSGVPRALAIDRQGRLWVGMYYDSGSTGRFYVVDTDDGSVLHEIAVPGQPYGASIGGDGRLWYVDGCCNSSSTIQSIQIENDLTQITAANSLSPQYENLSGCAGSYGIVVDIEGRVIMGGWPDSCIARFDPSLLDETTYPTTDGNHTGAWTYMGDVPSSQAISNNNGTRGVSLAPDPADPDGPWYIWTVSHNNNNVSGGDTIHKLNDDGTVEYSAPAASCGGPIGLAADFDNHIWTVCYASHNIAVSDVSTNGSPGDYYPHDSGGSGIDIAYPYTYSDFTGLHRALITAPEGRLTRSHDGDLTCGTAFPTTSPDPVWVNLHWEVDTPSGTSIEFWGRAGDDTVELALAKEFLIATVPSDESPANLATVLGALGHQNKRYLEIDVVLRADDNSLTPVFSNMQLESYCTCACDADAISCSLDPDSATGEDCPCDPECP